MSNPLYQEAMRNVPMNNIIQMLPQLANNPIQFALQQKGFNIPPNMANDPNGMIQYLLYNGMVSQNDYNNAIQLANNYRNLSMQYPFFNR